MESGVMEEVEEGWEANGDEKSPEENSMFFWKPIPSK